MSVAATVMFVAADANANPAFLGARRLCTRENAVFVGENDVSAVKPHFFASEAGDDFFPCSVKRPLYSRSLTAVISGETTIMTVAITGLFLGTTMMCVVTISVCTRGNPKPLRQLKPACDRNAERRRGIKVV